MDDGGFTGHGLKLYTNAFNVEELQLLIKALDKRPSGVGLKATIIPKGQNILPKGLIINILYISPKINYLY